MFPSDARPRRRVQQRSVVRARPAVADMAATIQRLWEDWSRIEHERGEGKESPRFEFASGAPARFVVGGVVVVLRRAPFCGSCGRW